MWFCSQIGAREHYAVPRVLHRNGQLAALYTDFWASRLTRKAAGLNRVFQSLATRFHPELEKASVRSWNGRALFGEARMRNIEGRQIYEHFANVGASFSFQVREALSRRRDLNSESIFFSYDTGALEAMEWCREHGIRCIVNQMDPNRIEVETVQEEEKRWPDWFTRPLDVPQEYFSRREREWAVANTVIVNSEYCRQALLKQGVPQEKLVIVPLCFEAENETQKPGRDANLRNKLRVLFLGQVILRKGIQYLVQAAKLLENDPIQFDVVGAIGISDAAVASAPRNMIFHGRATRDQTVDWYRQNDVFVLPTISDGFAITQLEAMSYGLPVVATPSCGAVVDDGLDGFIVPPRNADALARALQRYLVEPKLLASQREAALKKVKQFTLNHLAANLLSLGAATKI